ncbi:MAG: Ig-like domain-containing protein [Bacteroidetes bacterium]|nr:Ig-like domain-containing protein [Bacteroidota bacterium]
MNKMKNYSKMWLLPLLLIMIMLGCEDRVGITSPPVITIPTVISTNPTNAATGVAFNSKVTATFSEAMNSSTITTATFTLMQGTSFVSGTVSYTGITATFSPSSNLAPNTTYTATITTGAKDAEGSALAQNYVWSFTTGAAAVITPPNVSSTDPANAATGIALNQKIAATFSVAMDVSTITSSTFTLKQGTASVSGFVSYTGTTAIFAPASNLAPNTAYTATITTGAQDLAGNALATDYMWSFTTGAAAVVTPPTVSFTDPVNGATGVALNQKIAATFSRTMDATSIQTSTFILMQGSTAVTGFVSYSGTTAIFTPSSNLAASTVYTATITTGAKDLAGNALANNYVWSFTTGAAVVVTPPTVILTDPLNVATGVPLNQKIAATFSKTMDATTITTSTFTLQQGTTSVTGFVSYSGTTAIFAPANNLSPSTVYTATITTGAKDLAGNALVNNYVWSFTTGAATVVIPPTVISTDPANAATGIALAKQITATFSTTMDASTISTSTFTLMQGTTSVSGFVSYSGRVATFVPASNLAANTIYTATITTGAKDLAGNALASNYVWSFTTGAAVVVTPPTVSSTDPANAAIGVALNKQIKATFSKTMDASTITTSTFTLMQGTTPISGFVSYSGTTATFAPSNNLAPSTTYTATITTGAKDLAGISMTNNYVWSFTTVVPNYTVLLSSNPVAGGTTSGGGTFNSGSLVTVNATANTGYTFTNWTENGNPVSINASYTFTISGNRTLVANFTAIQYTVSLSSNPVAGGTTSGGGIFNSGSSVTVTATANAGYSFTNWTENGTAVSTNASYTFTISGNRTLVANFTALPAGPAGVNLGSAGNFAILAGSGVSNTGVTTHIYGDVGSFPTATINGLTAANVTGTLYTTADPIVGTAKDDLTTAYNDAQGRSVDAISLPGQLGGLTLAPGLYVNSTSSGISGTGSNAILTLDAGGNPNAVWIFKVGSTFITDAGTSIVLAGGAQWQNIYWSVGTSATLGTNSIFYGNILADQSITLTTGASLRGRALTRIAAVTLDTNIVDKR